MTNVSCRTLWKKMSFGVWKINKNRTPMMIPYPSNFRLRLKGRKDGGDAQEFLRFVTLSGCDLSRV